MLGIPTTPKEDINCTTAELVYASPLTVRETLFPVQTSPRTLFYCFSGPKSISKFNFTPMSQHSAAQHMPQELLLDHMCLFEVIDTEHHLHHPMRDRIGQGWQTTDPWVTL